MSKLDDFLERILWTVATRLSGRTAAALAFLLYAGGGLTLPLALHWSVLNLVVANSLATMLAGLVILGWLAVQLQARDRRHLIEWTSDLRLLSAEEFEWLVGEVFRREGWKVQETGSQEDSDGNIDLQLTRDGQRTIVQCKRWESWLVGVKEVREFAGTLTREGLPASAGIFVTLSDFKGHATAEARKMGITLVNNRDLHSRTEKVRRAEPCQICGKPMILGHSSRGWWFRCVSPGCQGKRDLGSDPGRAVDLLTQPPVTWTTAPGGKVLDSR
jgi:HJR/Mrr/RecB family endonuclease